MIFVVVLVMGTGLTGVGGFGFMGVFKGSAQSWYASVMLTGSVPAARTEQC